MRYCKKCVMPDTKPGIKFDKEGVCSACQVTEYKKTIDWQAREKELKKICDQFRGINGNYYDCLVPISGGKDSHFQVYTMKVEMGLNPLCVRVEPPVLRNFSSATKVGIQNLHNLEERFAVDCLTITLNPRVSRLMYRKGLVRGGIPNWAQDCAIYTYPVRVAINYKIPLIVWGENIDMEYGGVTWKGKETPWANDQINNDIGKGLKPEDWLGRGITLKDLNPYIYPSEKEIKKAGVKMIFLSYFKNWDGFKNYKLAGKYGFSTTKERRPGFIDNWEAIDDDIIVVHTWLKWIKFGFSRVTDVCSKLIRCGHMRREKAIKLVRKHEGKLGNKHLKVFLDYTGFTEREFWQIVEKHRNKKIWEKIKGKWRLKYPIK